MFTCGPGFTSSSLLNPYAVTIWPKLIAWWQMDAPSGSNTLADSHINGLTASLPSGAVFGSPTIRTGGPTSVLFNGNSQALLAVSLNAYVLGAQDHAVFVWYEPTSTTAANSRSILTSYKSSSGPSSTNNDQIGMIIGTSGNQQSAWRFSASSTLQNTTSARVLTASTGYFIGYNKQTSSKNVTHFINNVTETAIGYSNEPTGSAQSATIGALSGQTTLQAAGYMQNLTIFNAQLTTNEAAYLYNGGAGVSYATFKTASGH